MMAAIDRRWGPEGIYRSLVAARPGFFGVGILFYILASETIGFILCAFIILAASKQRRIRASFQRA